jgi:hypothetical protein
MKYRFICGQNKYARTICIEAETREEAEREIKKDYPMAEYLCEVITTTKRKEK